ncbi:MAG: MFS transporter [Pirellulales bacterium]|nr:MFS transporter [Pirellulales bacterium]
MQHPTLDESNVTTDRARERWALSAFIFSLATLQGLTINLMPLLFGPVARIYEVNLRQQGQLQSIFLAGGIFGLLVSGYVTEWFGARRSGYLAVGLITLGTLLLGVAGSYPAVLAGAAVMGLGNMWITAVFSSVITVHFSQSRGRMFMFAMAAFAASATLATTLFGRLFEMFDNWQNVFIAFAAAIFGYFLLFRWIAGRRLASLERTVSLDDEESRKKSKGLSDRLALIRNFLTEGLFNRVAFWLLVVLTVLDGIAANNIIAWTGRFFQQEFGVGDSQVGLILSASSAGVLFGRLFLGTFVSGRVANLPLLGICYAACVLMYVGVLLAPGYRVALVLIFFNGAFIAAQAPVMYAIAADKLGSRAATAIPLISAIGTVGGFATPALTGSVADYYGLEAALWLIPLAGCLMVAIIFTWQILGHIRRKHDA